MNYLNGCLLVNRVVALYHSTPALYMWGEWCGCVHGRQGVSRYHGKHDRLIYIHQEWVHKHKVNAYKLESMKWCVSEYMQLWLTWWNSRCLATDGSSKSGHSSPTSSKLSSVSTSSPGAWRLCTWWRKCEKRKQNRKRGRWKLDCLLI